MAMQPRGRMTVRPQVAGDGQQRRMKLITIDAKPGTTAEVLFRHYEAAQAAIPKLDAQKAKLASNQNFTDLGRQKQAVDYAFRELLPEFQKGRLAIRKAQQEVAAKRDKLVKPKADPADDAAARRRQEIRQHLLSLPDEQARHKMLREEGLFSGLNPELALAVIEMSPRYSGVSAFDCDEIIKRQEEALNGPALAEIQELEQAIDIAASAIETCRDEIRKETIKADPKFADDDEFNGAVSEVMAQLDAPWLKLHKENGAEILRAFEWDEKTQTGVFRVATQEQIDAGIIADSKNEYEKIKGVATTVFGTGEEGRRSRVAFVQEHGTEKFFARNNP
jgi:hypothetical protein